MSTALEPYLQATADGSDTLYSARYGQTFHSTFGALTEAAHVFLQGSGVGERLAAGRSVRVLEVGFGTGLNFFLTAQASRAAGAGLHYLALERDLLSAEVLTQLNHGAVLASVEPLRRAFLTWRSDLPQPVMDGRYLWLFDERLRLELVIGQATGVEIPALGYTAIYHDAFSPTANPELWTEAFFARLYALLEPGGRLATYSVKGTVRRNLQAVGFRVQKQPGPPGKREVLVASKGR